GPCRKQAGAASPSAAPSAASLPRVEEELTDVRSQLHMLTTRYTDEHPLVKELRERERALTLLANAAASTPAVREKPLAVRVPQDAAEEILRELTKQLNYVNVSLD